MPPKQAPAPEDDPPRDRPYLSYYDCRLKEGDIEALKEGWFTDDLILFWEEYLQHEYLDTYEHSHIILLGPSLCLMLMLDDDPASIRHGLPENFADATHLFLAVNDQQDPSQNKTISGEGSHWTLLVVSLVDSVAFHYDSLSPSNRRHATKMTQKLQCVLGRPIKFIELEDSPRQDNGTDCGVFVCLNMRHLLLKRLLSTTTNEKVTMSLGNRKVDPSEGRREMLRIIEGLRKEAEKRQSRSASPYPNKRTNQDPEEPPRIGSPIQR